jgi:general stress protein 26
MDMPETRRKLWTLIHACQTGVLITQGQDGFPHARTMESIRLDSVEEVWFATEAKERKLAEISREPRVTVFFTHPDQSWACLYGIAEEVTDQTLKSRLWKEEWEAYWPEGPVSGNYVLVRILPVAAEYLLQTGYERGRVNFKHED